MVSATVLWFFTIRHFRSVTKNFKVPIKTRLNGTDTQKQKNGILGKLDDETAHVERKTYSEAEKELLGDSCSEVVAIVVWWP